MSSERGRPFRRLARRFLAALALLATGAGCAPKSVPMPATVGMAGADAGCMDRAAPAARRYLDGAAGAAEIDAVWGCAARSLTLFVERAHGESEGLYTSGELRAFLETYFITSRKIPDGFLREAMELKRALIGGRADALTVAEIDRLQRLIAVLRSESVRLRPFMPLTPAAFAERSAEEGDAAAAALRESARALGQALEDVGIPYSFDRMSELFSQLEAFGSESPATAPGAGPALRWLGRARAEMRKIRALKRMFIGSRADRIAGDEWSTALEAGARWYGLYIRSLTLEAARARAGGSWMRDEVRTRALELVRGALDLVEEAVARQPRGVLSFDQIHGLLDLFFPEGEWELVPGRRVRLEHLKPLIEKVIRRMLGGQDRGWAGRAAQGLTVPALRRAWKAVEHWSEGQRYLEAMFAALRQGRGGAGISDELLARGFTAAELAPLTPERLIRGGFLSGGAGPALVDASTRLRRIIALDRPLFQDAGTQIHFDGFRSARRHSLHNLTQMNWMYEAARALMRGYSEAPAPGPGAPDDDRNLWVSYEEFRRFCDDIHDVSGDLKLIEVTDDKLPEKRFREASLFTFGGDGDERFSAAEAAQLLALMTSAKDLSVRIHEDIQAKGCAALGPDPYASVLIDPRCYRARFFGDVEHFWDGMPQLVAYFHRLSGAQRAEFERAVEVAARKIGYSDREPMHSGDSEGFAMAAHYLEVTFSRFDRDDSGVLDRAEADAAFPVFRRSLAEIACRQGSCGLSEGNLREVFAYMLAHGETPSKLDMAGWVLAPFLRRTVQADRLMIMKIFAKLASP